MGRMKELSFSLQEVEDHLDCIGSRDLEALLRKVEMVLQERALDAEFAATLENGEKVLDFDAAF